LTERGKHVTEDEKQRVRWAVKTAKPDYVSYRFARLMKAPEMWPTIADEGAAYREQHDAMLAELRRNGKA
jgi:hypothetical protein